MHSTFAAVRRAATGTLSAVIGGGAWRGPAPNERLAGGSASPPPSASLQGAAEDCGAPGAVLSVLWASLPELRRRPAKREVEAGGVSFTSLIIQASGAATSVEHRCHSISDAICIIIIIIIITITVSIISIIIIVVIFNIIPVNY